LRRSALLFAVAVLGASCTEDRPDAERPSLAPTASKAVCARLPGGVPEGFVLVRTRERQFPESVGLRKEYRDDRGRLLVYLLGIVQTEIGEGAPVVEDVSLTDDTDATLLGGPEGNWILTWRAEFPCEQISVVGNGFSREEFEALMVEARLLSRRPSG
jgi:hypothetical protein